MTDTTLHTKTRAFAEHMDRQLSQQGKLPAEAITFEHDGLDIHNPWPVRHARPHL